MEPSIAAAKAGVTTGEWGEVLREVFGEYRAPTGIHAKRHPDMARLEEVRQLVDEVSGKLGRRLTFVVGKPGLDGHSNGAEQIAVRATDVGMDVVYDGIRLTPAQIVEQAKEAKAHVLGLSILSGSHVALVRDVAQRMREAGMGEVPIVVGGIIPADDVNVLKQCGASAIYTPKDFQLNDIMVGIVKLVDAKAAELAEASIPVPPLRARERVPPMSRFVTCLKSLAVVLLALSPVAALAEDAPTPALRAPSPPAAATSWSRASKRPAPATPPAAPDPSSKARPTCSSTASRLRSKAARPAAAASIVSGASGVFINGKPMARMGDAAGCGGK